jgi:hypothetical protein
MTMTAVATTGLQTVSMTGSGDFQNSPNLGELTMTVSGARSATMRAVMRGTTIYMTSDLFRGQLPNGKSWLSLDVAKATKSLGADLGSVTSQSPADTLARLRASADVTEVGRATVGGVATTHYSAILDPDRVAKVTKGLGITISYAPVDVWVDRRGLVRRLHMAYVAGASSSVPQASMQMTMTLSRYGEKVRVSVPPAVETFDATSLVGKLQTG